MWAPWVLLWWLIAVAVGVQVLRRRISLLLVLAGAARVHPPSTAWFIRTNEAEATTGRSVLLAVC